MIFRRALVQFRKWANEDFKKNLLKFGSLFLVAVAAGILVDIFLPFGAWWNVLRSAILAPTALFGFISFYMIAVILSQRQVAGNPNWVTYRARWSPTWRRRIGIILGAVLFVMVYAVGFQPGYTLISSFIVMSFAAIFAFVRMTQKEIDRAELGAPDPRDHIARKAVSERQAALAAKQQQRTREAKLKRTRLVKGRRAAEELEEEFAREDNKS